MAGTGTPIEKVTINPFTVSEVLRLYLLSTSRESVHHVRYTFEKSCMLNLIVKKGALCTVAEFLYLIVHNLKAIIVTDLKPGM